LCIVPFVYEIDKSLERVPVKLVVHFDYLILLVYSACLVTKQIRVELAREGWV
jgi:hypothetical protein